MHIMNADSAHLIAKCNTTELYLYHMAELMSCTALHIELVDKRLKFNLPLWSSKIMLHNRKCVGWGIPVVVWLCLPSKEVRLAAFSDTHSDCLTPKLYFYQHYHKFHE